MSLQQRKNSLLTKLVIALVTALVSAAFTLGFASMGTSATAPEYSQEGYRSDSYTCSNATIKGAYGLLSEGFQGTEAPFTPVTAVRTSVFDGNGNFEGSGYFIVGGNIQQVKATGTYEVNSDCTVTITGDLNNDIPNKQFGVIVNGGRKILGLLIVPGLPGRNASAVYERVEQEFIDILGCVAKTGVGAKALRKE